MDQDLRKRLQAIDTMLDYDQDFPVYGVTPNDQIDEYRQTFDMKVLATEEGQKIRPGDEFVVATPTEDNVVAIMTRYGFVLLQFREDGPVILSPDIVTDTIMMRIMNGDQSILAMVGMEPAENIGNRLENLLDYQRKSVVIPDWFATYDGKGCPVELGTTVRIILDNGAMIDETVDETNKIHWTIGYSGVKIAGYKQLSKTAQAA